LATRPIGPFIDETTFEPYDASSSEFKLVALVNALVALSVGTGCRRFCFAGAIDGRENGYGFGDASIDGLVDDLGAIRSILSNWPANQRLRFAFVDAADLPDLCSNNSELPYVQARVSILLEFYQPRRSV
jgi:hypothetical protein